MIIGGMDIIFECKLGLELIAPALKIVLDRWPKSVIVRGSAEPSLIEIFAYQDKVALDRWKMEGASKDHPNTMIHLIFTSEQLTAVVDDDGDPMVKVILDDLKILLQASPEPEDIWTDIGHGVSIQFRELPGVESRGVAYRHPTPKENHPCEGYAPLKPEYEEGWDLIQREPLTISPSLLCLVCGHHGFIREGKWIPA